MPEPQMTVSSPADRLTQEEQIQQVVQRAMAQGDKLRIRIPFSLYDHAPTRTYVQLRDAAWNLSLPLTDDTPTTVQRLIFVIGRCISKIGEEGTEAVLKRLELPLDVAVEVGGEHLDVEQG